MGIMTIKGEYKLLPLVFLCLFYAYKSLQFPLHDFSNYYFGAYFLRMGQFNEALYFPYTFNHKIAELGFEGIFASYAPNSPFLALLLTPFSFMPPMASKVVFNLISIIFFILAIYRLFSFYKINWNYALWIPLLFFLPIKNEILFGQLYFILFYLLVESWIAYEQNQMPKSMFLLSIAILLKVFPIILIFIFIYKKALKPILYLGIFCLLLTFVSVLITGFDVWVFYLKEVLPKSSAGEISGEYVRNYQSLFMFLKELLVNDSTFNPNAPFNSPTLFTGILLAIKISVLSIGLYITNSSKKGLLTLSYWLLAAILISPYGSSYTFLLLIIPFLTLVQYEEKIFYKTVLLVLLFLINNLPLHYFIKNDFPFAYWRLFFLLLFCIAFTYPYFKYIRWKRITAIAAASLSLSILFHTPQKAHAQNILGAQTPLLLYDYTIQNQKLEYQYWDEKGAHKETIGFRYDSVQSLSLKGNKVFFGHQSIYLGKGNIVSPMLIDKHQIIYLSDEDRGIGFFKLICVKINPTL